MNTNAKFLTSDELLSALTDVLKLKSEEWTGGIAVNNLPGEFRIESIELWMHLLLEKGSKILAYAKGISIMKGRTLATNEDINQAFDVMGIGLDEALSRLTTRD